MNKPQIISLTLSLHAPFARPPRAGQAREERWFFESLSETCLPLLGVFERLDADHIPFKIALSLSPTFCNMLQDEYLLESYLKYTDKQMVFGIRQLDRISGAQNREQRRLALDFFNQAEDKRIFFTERLDKNVLRAFDYYQRKGRVELLTTAATHAFLPFYTGCPEAIHAQIETAIASHRAVFSRNPHGFWLPELGWSEGLDRYLRSYNFSYTIVDTHGLATPDNPDSRGSFYPVRTPAGVYVFARDFYAHQELEEDQAPWRLDPLFLNYQRDAGYELPAEAVDAFLAPNGRRTQTGYKYWAAGNKPEDQQFYDPEKAGARAREFAAAFLDARISRLKAAGEYLEEVPISLCAFDADIFGRFWHEGPVFIEALFREGARREGLQFINPAEYLYRQNAASFQTFMPEFSSWGLNGYGEMWLDSSNDWLYRHALRSLERMIELAERFPNETGLKERALNQAAREILLVQNSDWPRMLYKQEDAAYARRQLESALRNFTTIYEALGSNYLSTEWLTGLERRHNIFPSINYRVFRHKH
jgi:1,4-alpha-glucan branching enzyme